MTEYRTPRERGSLSEWTLLVRVPVVRSPEEGAPVFQPRVFRDDQREAALTYATETNGFLEELPR